MTFFNFLVRVLYRKIENCPSSESSRMSGVKLQTYPCRLARLLRTTSAQPQHRPLSLFSLAIPISLHKLHHLDRPRLQRAPRRPCERSQSFLIPR